MKRWWKRAAPLRIQDMQIIGLRSWPRGQFFSAEREQLEPSYLEPRVSTWDEVHDDVTCAGGLKIIKSVVDAIADMIRYDHPGFRQNMPEEKLKSFLPRPSGAREMDGSANQSLLDDIHGPRLLDGNLGIILGLLWKESSSHLHFRTISRYSLSENYTLLFRV